MRVPSLLFLFAARAVLAHDHRHRHRHHHPHPHEQHRIRGIGDDDPFDERELKKASGCGTREPYESDWNAFSRVQTLASFRANRKGASDVLAAAMMNTPRIIPVCFHVPQANRTGIVISNKILQRHLDLLNTAYTNTSCCDDILAGWCYGECSVNVGVQFVMAKLMSGSANKTNGTVNSISDPQACITRPVGAQWMQLIMGYTSETRIKKSLRVGDARTLNIYFVQILDKASRPDTRIAGYATWPWDYSDKPHMDGIVIQPITILGRNPRITTLPHEVGHWLGLFHTFQDGCDGGDGIPDTAPEAKPNYVCDTSYHEALDTCPGDEYPDPVFNFMDYSSGVCRYRFTEGQAAQLRQTIDMYRASGSFPSAPIGKPIQLNNGAKSAQLTVSAGDILEFTIEVPIYSIVHCAIINGKQGDLDLFMNWNGKLNNFECTGESDILNESCDIGPNTGTAHAFVYAVTGSARFRVKCSLYLAS